MTRGKQRVPVQCEDTDKISIQCQDDQFGLSAEVVYENESFPLTGSYHRIRVTWQNHTAAGQVQDSFAVNGQISAAAGFSTITDDMGVYSLIFTDGFLASSGIGDNSHELMNGDERYEKEKRVYPKGKKKKPKRGGRINGRLSRTCYGNFQGFHLSLKVSVQCEEDPNPNGYGGGVMVIGDETFFMISSCIPDFTGYNQYLARCGNQAGFITMMLKASYNDSHPRCSDGSGKRRTAEITTEGGGGVNDGKKKKSK